MQRIVPFGITLDSGEGQPVLLLRTSIENRFLPVAVGQSEAMAILASLEGRATPRPMTHDLMIRMLGELDAAITRVTVTAVRDDVFHALLTLSVDDREIEVDSRPSDAMALAVRVGAPIFAADDVIAEAAVEVSLDEGGDGQEEVVDEFRRFLDDVSPEEFGP